mmetsp:Transcript_51531/g.101144  ORF Transcript_51531/g.101144 Transcript_51531/m.101144 type:complete len:90 (+) Transcript_51531:396-665(+)
MQTDTQTEKCRRGARASIHHLSIDSDELQNKQERQAPHRFPSQRKLIAGPFSSLPTAKPIHHHAGNYRLTDNMHPLRQSACMVQILLFF